MLEKWLQKILMKTVGQVVDVDIAQFKLSWHSGALVAKNLALKPGVLEKIGLPLKVKLSLVNKISVAFPWKFYRDRPIVISFEDIYALVEPSDPANTNIKESLEMNKKMKLLDYLIESFAGKSEEEEKAAKKKKSRLYKSLYIADNIQLVIKNLHLRIEDPARNSALGLVLEELSVDTVNEAGIKAFIKRSLTDPEALRRQFTVRNLGLYCYTTKETDSFGRQEPHEARLNMKNFFFGPFPKVDSAEYIVRISAVLLLTKASSRSKGDSDTPKAELSITIPSLDFKVKKYQFDSFMFLIEFVTTQILLMKPQEKEDKGLQRQEVLQLQKEDQIQEFRKLLEEVYQSKGAKKKKGTKKKLKKGMDNETEKIARFKALLGEMRPDELALIVKQVFAIIENEKHEKQGVKEHCIGLFSAKHRHKKIAVPTSLTTEDLKVLETGYRKIYGHEDKINKGDLPIKNLFGLTVFVREGSVYICDTGANNEEKGILLSYKGVDVKTMTNTRGKLINVNLQDCSIVLKNLEKQEVYIFRKIFCPMSLDKQDNFFSIEIKSQAEGKDEGMSMNVDVRGIEVIYRISSLLFLVDYFKVPIKKKAQKNKSLPNIENQDEDSNISISKTLQSVKKIEFAIKMTTFMFLIPFSKTNDNEVERDGCLMSLGIIDVNGTAKEVKDVKSVQNVKTTIKDMKVYYFPNHDLYLRLLCNFIKQEQSGHQLVPDDHDRWQIFEQQETTAETEIVCRKKFLEVVRREYEINVNVTFPKLYLVVKSRLYKKMIGVLPHMDELIKLLIHVIPPQPSRRVENKALKLNMDIESMNVVLPIPPIKINRGETMFIFQSGVSLSVSTPQMPGIKRTLKFIREKSLAKLLEPNPNKPHFDIPVTTKIGAKLKQAEFYKCYADTYTSDSVFTYKKRRNLILPFELDMTRNMRSIPDTKGTGYIPSSSTQINTENLVGKIALSDVQILLHTIEYQKKQLAQGYDEGIEKKFKKQKSIKPEVEKQPRNILEDLQYQGNGIQLFFIDDIDGVRAPVIKVTFLEPNIDLDIENQTTKLEGGFYLTAAYFNPIPARWEPFIEESGLDFGFSIEKDVKTNIYVTNKKDTKVINLNVSDQMVSTLYPIFANLGKQDQQKLDLDFSKTTILGKGVEERVLERTSPYVIINETGYPIQIDTVFTLVTQNPEKGQRDANMFEESFYVENMGSCSCLIEPNTNFVFERGTHDRFVVANKIKVKILHPTDQINPIENLHIDKMINRMYHVKGKAQYSTDPEDSDYYICSLMEIHKTKKIITLTSSVSFVNKFCKPCKLIFESKGQKVETKLDVEDTARVPIDFLDGTLSVVPVTCDVVPESVLIKHLINYETGDYHFHEFQSGSTFVVARPAMTDDTPKMYGISLLAPFEMKNCCGVELFYRMRVQGEGPSEEYKSLKPQETSYDTSLSLNCPIYIQVQLQGYNWCEEVLVSLSNEKVDRIENIYIGGSHKTSYLKMFIPKGELRRRKILLYTGSCIVNETPYNFFYDFISKHRKEELVPGNKLREQEGLCSSKITLANDMKALVISRPEVMEQSDIVHVERVGRTTAELYREDELSLLELGINVTSLKCDQEYNMTTKIITISPRYVVINMTSLDIEMKREFGTKSLGVFEREVRTPLYWSDWEPLLKERISVRYREEGKDEDYWEWSNVMNIQDPGIYDGIILPKNGEQAEMKFIKITVNLVAPTIFVVIEEDLVDKPTILNEPAQPKKKNNILDLQVVCTRLGLSIISTVNDPRKKVDEPKEFIYALFSEIHFSMVKDLNIVTYQAKLEHLNIDNNACYDTLFPVLWTPVRPYIHKQSTQTRFLELTISQRITPKITSFLENVDIKLGSSIIKMDSQFRNVLKETLNNFMELSHKEGGLRKKKIRNQTIAQTLYKSQKSAMRIHSDEDFMDQFGWMKVELSKAIFKTQYIRKLSFKAVSLKLSSELNEEDTQNDIYELLLLASRGKRKKTKGMSSLHKAMKRLSKSDPHSEESVFLKEVAGVIGQFISHLDNLTLDLADVSLENEFDSPDAIGNKIARKYISKAGKTILRIMEALGKTTVSRIFNKESLKKPETIDDECRVQNERSHRKRLKRIRATEPNNTIDNRLSVQRMDDFSIDLVRKPFSGDVDDISDNGNQFVIERVNDAITKFFKRGQSIESVTSETSLILGSKPSDNRARLPRAFYGECQTFKAYSHIDAEALWRLYFSLGNEYEGLSHITAFDGFSHDNQEEFHLLIISSEVVIWHNTHNDKIKWAVVLSDIESVDCEENGLVIQLKKIPEYLEEPIVRLRTLDKGKDEFVRQTLISMIDPSQP